MDHHTQKGPLEARCQAHSEAAMTHSPATARSEQGQTHKLMKLQPVSNTIPSIPDTGTQHILG